MRALNIFVMIAILCMTTGYSTAQNFNNCACCTENHTAFNFWLGDWTVYNSSGNIIGTNKVVKMQNGCVLQENWVASNNSNTGTSYNFFDLSDSTWNQVWISGTGNVLRLKGNLDTNGAMVLKSELITGLKGKYFNQITWSINNDGSVTQRWDILNEKNDAISKAFEGIYRKLK